MCRVLAAAAVVLLLWPARAHAQPADERWDEEGDEWMEEPDALEAAAALDQVRERVMRELGLTSQPVRVSGEKRAALRKCGCALLVDGMADD